ncbi:MAG: sigma-70 family RNA polymerase sigma factor [Candidatus Eisenbacteria sp.]|nr:sigma-70 family RNA polymerase sigma factor [Candidatus Eisenbacteria bacterium]
MAREDALGDAWLLLNSSIFSYLQQHTTRLGVASREDLEDLAAENALDLLRRITNGKWEITNRHPAEVAGYLSTVARHALMALQRRSRRRALPRDENRDEWDMGQTGAGQTMGTVVSPDQRLECREFAAALRQCAEELSPLARRVWFLRVFCQMSSAAIAAHPEVGIRASHVDVRLQRTRRTMRACMKKRGYAPQDMPPGTFAELVKLFGDPSVSVENQGGSQ